MPDTQGLLSQFYVTIDGLAETLAQELMADVLEVTVESSLHLPDVATLVMHDSRLKWLDDAKLEPGKGLTIASRVDAAEHPIFDGEIVEIEPDFRPGSQRFVLRAFDRLHRLSRGRRVRSFQNVTDSDLVSKIAREMGLDAQVEGSGQLHPYLLQANETNLAFLQARAAALGHMLYADGKALCLKPVREDGTPVELKWAESLLEFRPRMTTLGQVETHTVRGWDPKAKREIIGQSENGNGAPKVGESRQGGKMSAQAFRIPAQHLTADRPVREQSVADRMAQAQADRGASGFIQADGVAKGEPKITAGSSIKLANVGTRFSGTYFVTTVLHRYDAEHGYTTEFTVSGQHPVTLLGALAPDRPAPVGDRLVIGIVTDNADPEKLGRVKVRYPWLSPDHASDWARVVAPGAGRERGLLYLPEIDDEVLVGFELGDVNHPYVLGGLWNGKDAPPGDMRRVVAGSKVEQRIIRSRTGHTIVLDDSDGDTGILIEDAHGNVVHLETSRDALTVKTKGDVTVEATGNVSVKANGSLTLEADGQVQIKGASVSIEGSASVDVQGGVINLN